MAPSLPFNSQTLVKEYRAKVWALPIDPVEFITRLEAYNAARTQIDCLHEVYRSKSVNDIQKLSVEILDMIAGEILDTEHDKRTLQSLIEVSDLAGLEDAFLDALDDQLGTFEDVEKERHYGGMKAKLACVEDFQRSLEAWNLKKQLGVYPKLQIAKDYFEDHLDDEDIEDEMGYAEDYDESGNSKACWKVDLSAYIILDEDPSEARNAPEIQLLGIRGQQTIGRVTDAKQEQKFARALRVLKLIPLGSPQLMSVVRKGAMEEQKIEHMVAGNSHYEGSIIDYLEVQTLRQRS
ncbi:uncharacterized protein KY384_002241 [Bacidia gigantensis]|uniref:uncharacterized protein n=1 Tax=Bacidia gigantensis TaxID=2732470 RepID=UPI001D0475EC|nr:uncharacterized protein KY384_002241 [Bacidia gigantensis]KAG8533458.1 hypothetical protein KY384_002241 [Bacidia gigantensis]